MNNHTFENLEVRNKNISSLLVLVSFCALTLTPMELLSQNLRVAWSIFRPGHVRANSSRFLVDGTIGEPFMGSSQSQNFFLRIGHFYSTQIATAVNDWEVNGSLIPDTYDLSHNYPNPFNPSTTVRYSLPRTAHVTLRIFNTLGQEIATLVDGEKNAGFYQVQWNAAVPSGIYFYRLQAGEFAETKKMILLR